MKHASSVECHFTIIKWHLISKKCHFSSVKCHSTIGGRKTMPTASDGALILRVLSRFSTHANS